MRAAELVLEVLKAHGVEHIFGIPGDAINDITDAIRRRDDIRFIQVRHEEAGAFAAGAQAKLTGRLSACMGTAGPGAIHLLNGLYDAAMDHAPVVAITGQVETRHIGTDYHQEVDLERLFGDVSVYSQTVTRAEQLPAVILEACRAAIAGRGVAHVSLPTDVAGSDIDVTPGDLSPAPRLGVIHPSVEACQRAVDLLDGAGRIAVLAGIGCGGARKELLDFAAKAGAPIVRTLRAKDVIDDDEPQCVGGLGLLGTEPGLRCTEDCDLLVMVGTDFPYADFYPRQAQVIQIDTVATQIGKRHPVDVGLVGHAGPTLDTLTTAMAERSDTTFLERMQDAFDVWRRDQDQVESADETPIKPQRLMRDIHREAPDDAIFVVDTGTVDAWSARHLPVGGNQRYTLSSSLGSMAFALPGAIGARLAFPHRPVFALAGDGGFAMLMADFVTAVREDLPLVCVILNNGELGFIRLEQEAKGLPQHAIDLPHIDFAAFARACGGAGVTVREPGELRPALRRALDEAGPVIIDVHVDPDELIIPPRIHLKEAVNFGIAKAREFLGGD